MDRLIIKKTPGTTWWEDDLLQSTDPETEHARILMQQWLTNTAPGYNSIRRVTKIDEDTKEVIRVNFDDNIYDENNNIVRSSLTELHDYYRDLANYRDRVAYNEKIIKFEAIWILPPFNANVFKAPAPLDTTPLNKFCDKNGYKYSNYAITEFKDSK